MIVIAMTVNFEDIYSDNFFLKENFGVQHENLPGTYLKPLISLTYRFYLKHQILCRPKTA